MSRDPNRQLGRYELMERVGTGGMAELFVARYEGPGGFEKRCAIKRLLPQRARNEALTRQLSAEAKVIQQFEHPNVVEVYELGQADGQLFIAMEWIDGLSLRALHQRALEAGGQVPTEVVTWILGKALDGLGYAHSFDGQGRGGVVHRDVSPQNILVSWDGMVKIVDFGLARAAAVGVGQATDPTLAGKLPYMSPEQVSGEPMDPRSDLFSLAVCAFELLTGERPFDAASDIMTARAIAEAPAPPLASACPDAPPALADVLERALQKHPEDRFESAAAMGEAIADILRTAAQPLDRHAVAQYLAALREGEPDRYEHGRYALPRPRGARPFAGPDPYAQFVPSARPAPELAPSIQPPRSAPSAPPPEDLQASLAAAGLAGPTKPWLPALVAALLVVGLALSWRVFRAEPNDVDTAPLAARPTDALADSGSTEAAMASAPITEPEPIAAPEPPPTVAKPEPFERREEVPVREESPPVTPVPRVAQRVVKTPKPVRRTRRGRLRLRSSPSGLAVRLGRRRLGTTPLEVPLAAGTHALVVMGPGGSRRPLRVKIASGRTATEQVVFRQGRLRILARPWARVFLDGRLVGTTPVTVDAYEGPHALELRPESGPARRQQVVVVPGETTTLKLKLEG